MNYTDTIKSIELVLATGEVPLIVGESGIGKTALAKQLAKEKDWSLVVIDGNLLKEGEIGGLPTIDIYTCRNAAGELEERKATVYAVHNKLREIDEETAKGRSVLLFIDEINRCEHTVQQELMNLILNREINGYRLKDEVKVLAAMNPSAKYGPELDYQVVDMDAAQENRFVWLYMEPDYMQWLDWAIGAGLEPKVIEFISTFPEYLHKRNEEDISATPRSYERISKVYQIYKENVDKIPRAVFLNVLRGNVGKLIAEEFLSFAQAEHRPLISYEEVFEGTEFSEALVEKVRSESHTRLYLSAKNILKLLEGGINKGSEKPDAYINRLNQLLKLYPADLRVGIMKDIRNSYPQVYSAAIDNDGFVDMYYEAYM